MVRDRRVRSRESQDYFIYGGTWKADSGAQAPCNYATA